MTIKIQAAARLRVVAKADEGQAREYLQSLGVSVGAKVYDNPGYITFAVKDVASALRALKTALGAPKVVDSSSGNGKIYEFKLEEGRIVQLVAGQNMIALLDSKDRQKFLDQAFG